MSFTTVGLRRQFMRSAMPIGLGLATLGLATAAMAQAAAPAPAANTNTVGEVVVTAQFREQNLQKTPLAITAVNAQMLENRSQTNVFQVANEAPNVSLRPASGTGGSAMIAFIRGVGQTDFNFSQEPGVGIYVDDVYYATLTGSLLDLMDLDRVEVLRGPQGTLSGRNAIGGAIKLFSKKPDGAGGGYMQGTYGSLNRIDVKAGADFVVVPDKLFVRISGATRHHDGYVTRLDYKCTHPASPIRTFSVGDSCTLGKEGGQAFDAGKISLRWMPSERVEVNFSADATNDQSPAQPGTLLFARPNGMSLDGVAYDSKFVTFGPNAGDPLHSTSPYVNYATYVDPGPPLVGADHLDAKFKPVIVDPINHFKTWGIGNTIDIKLADKLSLKSITSYRRYNNAWAQDTSGSPVGVELLLQTLHHTQWTQELRLNGNVFNAVDFTLGGFYVKQTGDETARVDLPYVAAGAAGDYNGDFDFQHGPDTTPSTSKAAFLNADWQVTDRINVIAGVRYSQDEKVYTYHRHNPDGTPVACPVPNFLGGCTNFEVFGLDGISNKFSGSRWDYRGDIDFKITNDVMVYGSISTGYKGGGANARPFFPPGPGCADPRCQVTSFNPETLTAYEGGFKATMFDHRVRFNGAGFFNKYNSIILTLGTCPLNTPGGAPAPCGMPQNVGNADVKGLEFETEAHPFGGLELDGSLSYLDFKYTNTNFAATGVALSAVPPFSPKWKWNIGIQYAIDMPAGGSFTPRLDLTYQSDVFAGSTNTPQDLDPSKQVVPATAGLSTPHADRISGYTLANARLTYRSKDGDWSTSVEVTNLTNKLYWLTLADANGGVGYISGQPAMGREWAVTVKKTF